MNKILKFKQQQNFMLTCQIPEKEVCLYPWAVLEEVFRSEVKVLIITCTKVQVVTSIIRKVYLKYEK